MTSLLAVQLVATPAGADEGELTFGPHVASSRPGSGRAQVGATGQLTAAWLFSDFFALYGGLEGGYHFGRTARVDGERRRLDGFALADVFVGLRYHFDVFTYIPWVAVSVVGYGSAPPASDEDASRPALGTKLSLGLTYRRWRHWSIGGVLEAHSVFPQFAELSLYGSFGLRIGYHFRL
jgi:hypothetical protein